MVLKNGLKKGKYNNWEVYAKSDKDICYTTTRPKKMEGEYKFRGRVDLVVAIKNNYKNKYYVGLDFGYTFSNNDKVKLIIDNKVVFEIDTFAQNAWINSVKYPGLNIKIIEAMKKGYVLTAKGTSKKGTETIDTYSLVGLRKLLKKLKMSAIKNNVYNLTKKDLKSFIANKKIKLFRADQIWNWLYVKGVNSFSEMHNLPYDIIRLLDNNFIISLLKVKKSFTSEDGTKKWLFELKDKREIETVFIPEGKRGTICVSSQVGCSLSCSFCYTGTMKLERNLDLEEILGQIMTVKFFLDDWRKKLKKSSY